MTDFNNKHGLASYYKRRGKEMQRFLAIGLLVFSMFAACLPGQAQTYEQAKINQTKQALASADGAQIKAAVNKYSVMYGLEKELILAVILTESGFNKHAKSPQNCSGLMQLAPATFRARNVGTNIFSIDQNIHAGVKHLAGLKGRYKGDTHRMLAAYNYGGGRIYSDRPIPAGAQKYVNKVMYHKQIMKQVTF